ncbi:hypothetical protein M9Y10_029680 [Tritrichomonas musculus]|uniref:Uncharacterized protein n=1 Tax=Tritrichomonas musculus TaxID=1915356 RepID=A0ABR2KNG5_9EUKA
MSPAFLNRFEIIVLENQISESISEEQFKKLVITLLERYSSEILVPKEKEKEEKMDKGDFFDFDFDEEDLDNKVSYKYSDTIIPIICKKLWKERKAFLKSLNCAAQ